MKRSALILALALVTVVAGLAFAGGEECAKADKAKAAKTADHHAHAAKEKVAMRAEHGWLGIETEKTEAGYAVSKVYPGGPAAAAGFRTGDVLVALNGIRFAAENKAELKAAKRALAVGSEVAYTVARGGYERTLSATLAAVPQEVLARWEAEAAEEASRTATQVAEND
jgi:predicted metalloprotease with PDZ domain